MLAIEDKRPAGLHHWNAAGVSFCTYECVCLTGVRAVPPLRKPFQRKTGLQKSAQNLSLTEFVMKRA